MDCQRPETVNICSELECLNSTVTFGVTGSPKPHLPSHGMFKVRRNIFSRDVASIQRAAREALELERENIFSAKEDGAETLWKCIHCKIPVSPPYWRCLECSCEWEYNMPNHRRGILCPDHPVQLKRGSYVTSVNPRASHLVRRTPICIRWSESPRKKKIDRQRNGCSSLRKSWRRLKGSLRTWWRKVRKGLEVISMRWR